MSTGCSPPGRAVPCAVLGGLRAQLGCLLGSAHPGPEPDLLTPAERGVLEPTLCTSPQLSSSSEPAAFWTWGGALPPQTPTARGAGGLLGSKAWPPARLPTQGRWGWSTRSAEPREPGRAGLGGAHPWGVQSDPGFREGLSGRSLQAAATGPSSWLGAGGWPWSWNRSVPWSHGLRGAVSVLPFASDL